MDYRIQIIMDARPPGQTPTKTYKQLGVEFGISGSRVRQIHEKHLRVLKHPRRQKIAKLSTRAKNVLREFGITEDHPYLSWGRSLSVQELLHSPNCGKKTVEEISTLGLNLIDDPEAWSAQIESGKAAMTALHRMIADCVRRGKEKE